MFFRFSESLFLFWVKLIMGRSWPDLPDHFQIFDHLLVSDFQPPVRKDSPPMLGDSEILVDALDDMFVL